MADKNINATLGTSAANHAKIDATINMTVKLTRGYIWMFKLKCIWAVIRAKVNSNV